MHDCPFSCTYMLTETCHSRHKLAAKQRDVEAASRIAQYIALITLSTVQEATHACCCRQRVQPKRGLVQEAGGVSGSSTEGSRASRPKRAVNRFDYSVLNGTSGNLGAMLQAGEQLNSCQHTLLLRPI